MLNSTRHVKLIRQYRLVWRTTRTPRRCLLTLAIETSCDDTCVALLEYNKPAHLPTTHEYNDHQARLHHHVKVTAPNTGKGGIHPVEAANSHRANLADLVKGTFDVIRHRKLKLEFVTVTRGPGMHSNLSCGLDTAKGLAVALNLPLMGVHHMQAHALTPRLLYALQTPIDSKKALNALQHNDDGSDLINKPGKLDPEFPFLTLLVSGGHTMLLHSKSLTDHTTLANTMDIAIGDALDKCGRLILPSHLTADMADTAYAKHLSAYAFPDNSTYASYPISRTRGAEIDKPLNEHGWRFQLPLGATRKLAFSYAGLASQVEKIMKSKPDISDAARLALARTVMGTAFEHLGSRTIMALEALRDQAIPLPRQLVVSGGVAANDFLRYFLRQMLDLRGFGQVELVFPPIYHKAVNKNDASFAPCTDNAAMIAWAGMEMYLARWRSGLDITAVSKWSMDPNKDGGILGVPGWYNSDTTLV